MEKHDKNKKVFSDETTEFRILKKHKKSYIIEDDDLKSLQDTREFRKIESKDGKLISRYSPTLEKGLTLDQVQKRREEGLINKTKNKYEKSFLQIIVKNFFTFLNLLLFGICALMLISGVKGVSNYFFMLIISSNLIIGIVQEIRAKIVIDKLSLVTKTKVKTLRNSIKIDVDAEDIVLDDIYYLSTGQKIVTDSIVVDGNVEVNESLLTGESLPVKKNVGDIVFAGSFISSGTCTCKVERVGDDNYITQLQERAKREKKNNSVILKSLNIIIGIISMCVIPFGIYNFISKWASMGWTQEWVEIQKIITNTCGSMVAMIPSGLYLTVSVTLVVSVMALARKNTLVQDSYAIEMLARTDVLCLDKTGTITDGTMELHDEIEINKNEIDIVGEVLGSFEERNQTSEAILAKHPYKGTYNVISKLPFSSSRKMSAVKFEDIGTYVIGAPEFVLTPDHPVVKDLEKYTMQGYRVLLLGKVDDLSSEGIIGDVEPLKGYIIKDHIRDTAPETLKWFKENEVEIKIISGDNPLTVSEIAKQAGVDNAENYVSLEGMNLEEVSEAATKYTVFGRVAPEQKATLVTALKKANKTVAMTGDGVNDILALKISDCSIAMASGSEAARNVSSIVLIDSDFANLPRVVAEGRRVINNVTEVASLFLMKTIFAILLTLSTKYPFEPSNLMVIEIFCSGLAAFALALQPNNRKIKGGFLRNVLSKAVPGGITYALGVLAIVLILEGKFTHIDDLTVYKQTIGGLYLSTLGILTLFFHCLPLNKFRTAIFSLMTVATLAVCFTPIGEFFAHFYIKQLEPKAWLLYGIVTICGVILFLGSKFLFDHFIKKHEERKKN
ncbi:MAG: HAD family hydrolase [Erysipelotrichaceae bacterium]|nr:HAD family hydrolase [Erysipelotrichaceae bacterium]